MPLHRHDHHLVNNNEYSFHVTFNITIFMHTHRYPNQQASVYTPLLGKINVTGASIQSQAANVHTDVKRWVTESEDSGWPWVVTNDEQGSANNGIFPDDDYPSTSAEHTLVGDVFYGTLMAGGAGVEAYFGYVNLLPLRLHLRLCFESLGSRSHS
jgi:hypothetical protein